MKKVIHFVGSIFTLILLLGTITPSNAQLSLAGDWSLVTNDKEENISGFVHATSDSVYINLNAHQGQLFDVKYRIDKEGKFTGQAIGDLVVVIQGVMAKGNPDIFGITIKLRSKATDEKFSYMLKAKRKKE